MEELEERKLVRLDATLEGKNRAKVLEVIKSRISTFTWKPEDVIGIDPIIITHKLNVDPSAKPVKQKKQILPFKGKEQSLKRCKN